MARPLLIVPMPSLRISGGNKEVVRLVQEIIQSGQVDAMIACMWKHPYEIDTGGIRVVHLSEARPDRGSALLQLPGIVLAFRRLLGEIKLSAVSRLHLLLGHYSTYLLAWAAPHIPRICFNQDMEWLFVPAGWRRAVLKRLILATNRRACVVTTNGFITASYRSEGITVFGEASIWAEPMWLTPQSSENRDIDVLMLLRGSGIKRLDLYQEALRLFRSRTDLRIAVITPDTAVAEQISADLARVFLRPEDGEMRGYFARSRTFLLLSDVEGFGLPPLEAMGGGCVPVCRDSGGVRCYMHGPFADLLFALDRPVTQIVDEVADRIQNKNFPSPQTARQAFAEGLKASRDSRTDCVRRLRAMLMSAAGK